jgi:hypothetical protein
VSCCGLGGVGAQALLVVPLTCLPAMLLLLVLLGALQQLLVCSVMCKLKLSCRLS